MLTNEQEGFNASLDVEKRTCSTEGCGKVYWAPVFVNSSGEESPAIICEECVHKEMKSKGLATEANVEKIKKIYQAAEMQVN